MSKVRVYALTMDRHWGKVLQQVGDESLDVGVICCPDGYPNCLESLPTADPDALLLLDATGLKDVAGMVRRLRQRRWQHIVVVAADPTAKEANAVFKAGGHDYWRKTSDVNVVRSQVRAYVRRDSLPGIMLL